MAVEYLGKNSPDGVSVGLSSTELVSFHGATPIAQATVAVTVTTTATAAAVGTDLAALRTALVNKGLIAV